MENKVYVAVKAQFQPSGRLTPLTIQWDDTEYEIDRVLDVCRAASLKGGGTGLRYSICIGGQRTFLFLEGNRWFVERH